MFRSFSIFSGFVLLALSGNCQGQSGAQVLSVQAYETRLRELSEKNIVDVRTASEYNQGRLKGAILIDYYQRDFQARLTTLDKTKPVFVYCASGVRSNSAATMLIKLGFKEVYDLRGGFLAWRQAGKPIDN